MNFQDLKKVEDHKTYIDIAFKRASRKIDEIRSNIRGSNRLLKSREIEIRRIEIIKDTLINSLNRILKSFPSFGQLDIFYQELIKCHIDYKLLKKSLGAVNWAADKTDYFFSVYRNKIKRADITQINKLRKEFYGRIASVLKQIKKNLVFLEDARKIMRNFPAVKTSVYTICIVGFPNVGKSTLLSKLTTATPEINSYPFTTKALNLGYIKEPGKKLQLIDTPGTLNRMDRMNNIELQAYLALKHLADQVVYVFDPTLEYDLKKQVKLLKKVKEFDKPVILFLSKTDTADKEVIKEFKEKYKDIFTSYAELKKELMTKSKSY